MLLINHDRQKLEDAKLCMELAIAFKHFFPSNLAATHLSDVALDIVLKWLKEQYLPHKEMEAKRAEGN